MRNFAIIFLIYYCTPIFADKPKSVHYISPGFIVSWYFPSGMMLGWKISAGVIRDQYLSHWHYYNVSIGTKYPINPRNENIQKYNFFTLGAGEYIDCSFMPAKMLIVGAESGFVFLRKEKRIGLIGTLYAGFIEFICLSANLGMDTWEIDGRLVVPIWLPSDLYLPGD